MYKIDLHTHSVASADGGIKPDQYAKILRDEVLDFVAITDHDRIDFALGLHQALGDKIIVGQEVSTTEGEIIGLFLTEPIIAGKSVKEAARQVKKQGGLVYIPHPFEKVRRGLDSTSLESIIDLVDIVEVINGRALNQTHGPKAATWAITNKKASAASSDAHGLLGVGKTYSVVFEKPTKENLKSLLKQTNNVYKRPPVRTFFYPKINRLRKKIGLSS
jgi:predicted metal-dependent phosphoesterase TrpH